jgi:hypothetical protein
LVALIPVIRDAATIAESDYPVRGSTIVGRHPLLHAHRKSRRAIDAVEHHEQRITPSVDDPAAVRHQRRLDQVMAQPAHPIERSAIDQTDQPALADHVGMNHRDQPPPIC